MFGTKHFDVGRSRTSVLVRRVSLLLELEAKGNTVKVLVATRRFDRIPKRRSYLNIWPPCSFLPPIKIYYNTYLINI